MQEDKGKMVEIKIYLDLKITKMHSKIVAGFYSSHLLVFVRLAKLYRCRVFSSIENRPLSSKNFVICVYHRLDNISVHAPWTLIGRYTKIVMMYVSFGKAKLKKICPESDRFSHCSKVKSFWWSKISTDKISCKRKRKLQQEKNPKIHTKYCCRFHKIKPKKPGLFDAISDLT